jgi:soluble P-type ATPase
VTVSDPHAFYRKQVAMIEIAVPGHANLRLQHLVLDYNGTMACDGRLIEGVADALGRLAPKLHIHVLTADTFGSVRAQLRGIACELSVLGPGNQDVAKLEYVKGLGADTAACVGNGRNDRLMLKEAALGIAVVQGEGAATETLLCADIVCPTIGDALSLLVNPVRIAATLRS